MIIIQKKILNELYLYWNQSIRISFILFVLSICNAQISNAQYFQPTYLKKNSDISIKKDTVPEPRSVMMKSVFIPGWGQIQNEQWWKVPIIYSAFIGVGYYIYWLDGQYGDFQAAYYNSFSSDPQFADQKYGPTPTRLIGVNQNELKNLRNYYRNERDLWVLLFGVTYGLNVLDAYIFAHLKDFDVSDNLALKQNPVGNGQYLAIKFKYTW